MSLQTVLVVVGENETDQIEQLAETAIDIAGQAGATVALGHVSSQDAYENARDRLQFESLLERWRERFPRVDRRKELVVLVNEGVLPADEARWPPVVDVGIGFVSDQHCFIAPAVASEDFEFVEPFEREPKAPAEPWITIFSKERIPSSSGGARLPEGSLIPLRLRRA